jgi:hypothetical protein
VLEKERHLARNPRVLLTGMAAVSAREVRHFLEEHGVDVIKVTSTPQCGHEIVLSAVAETQKLLRLHRATVDVNVKDVILSMVPVAPLLTTSDILDHVSQKICDEETYRDSQQAAHAVSTAQAQKFAKAARRLRASQQEDDDEPQDQNQTEWEEPHRVAPVTSAKQPPKPKPAQPEPVTEEPLQRGGDRGKGKGQGKGKGKGGGKGGNWTQGEWQSGPPGCWMCGDPNHISWVCPKRVCLSCNGVGHVYWECPRGGPGAYSAGKGGKGGKGVTQRGPPQETSH